MTRKIVLLLMLMAILGFAKPKKKSAPDLPVASGNQMVDVIVRYNIPPDDNTHKKVKDKGGKLKKDLSLIRASVFSVPASALQAIADDADVAYVTPDRTLKGAMDYAEPAVNANIALKYGFDGSGVTVAVIDSGIADAHPDLQDNYGRSRVVYAENFNPNEPNAVDT